MPYRTAAANVVITILEGILFGSLALYHGVISIFSDADWEKVTGPHGVAFISLLAVVVLWNQGRIRERNENRRRREEMVAREMQHDQTISLQKENAERLCALTAENIKAAGMTAAELGKMLKASESLSHEVRGLAEAVAKNPCHATTFKNMFSNFPQMGFIHQPDQQQ